MKVGNDTYWLDPTNDTSMAGLTFNDVSAKHALVLADNIDAWQETSSFDPKYERVDVEQQSSVSEQAAKLELPSLMQEKKMRFIGKAFEFYGG